MKLFRSAYSELSRQHAVLILSLLFFNFDYAHLNEGFPINYFVTAILFSKVRDGLVQRRNEGLKRKREGEVHVLHYIILYVIPIFCVDL